MKQKFNMFITIVVCAAIISFTGCNSTSAPTEAIQETSGISSTQPVVTETATEAAPEVSQNINLRSGYWCYYDGKGYMSAYTFSDEKLDNGKYVGYIIAYDVKNGVVSPMDVPDYKQMTNYEIKDGAVLVTGEGGSVTPLYFSDTEDSLVEKVNEKTIKHIHFASVPNYNDLKSVSFSDTANTSESAREYTAEELLTMSVTQILDLMDNTITVEYGGNRSTFGSSIGVVCFYNDEKLPGFVFSPKNTIVNPSESELADIKEDILSGEYTELQFVAMMDGAKLNAEISADMTYNQISAVTGDYSNLPPAGAGNIRQDLSSFCDGAASAEAVYETNNEDYKHLSGNGFDVDYVRQINPVVKYIIANIGR